MGDWTKVSFCKISEIFSSPLWSNTQSPFNNDLTDQTRKLIYFVKIFPCELLWSNDQQWYVSIFDGLVFTVSFFKLFSLWQHWECGNVFHLWFFHWVSIIIYIYNRKVLCLCLCVCHVFDDPLLGRLWPSIFNYILPSVAIFWWGKICRKKVKVLKLHQFSRMILPPGKTLAWPPWMDAVNIWF